MRESRGRTSAAGEPIAHPSVVKKLTTCLSHEHVSG